MEQSPYIAKRIPARKIEDHPFAFTDKPSRIGPESREISRGDATEDAGQEGRARCESDDGPSERSSPSAIPRSKRKRAQPQGPIHLDLDKIFAIPELSSPPTSPSRKRQVTLEDDEGCLVKRSFAWINEMDDSTIGFTKEPAKSSSPRTIRASLSDDYSYRYHRRDYSLLADCADRSGEVGLYEESTVVGNSLSWSF